MPFENFTSLFAPDDLQTDFPAQGSSLGLSNPATNSGDSGWGNIAMLIASAIEGGAAGYQGRSPQSPSIILRQQQMEQQTKSAQEQRELQRLTVLPNLMKMIEHIQDNVPAEGQADAIKTFAPVASAVFGPEMNEKTITSLVGGGAGKVADFNRALPAAAELFSERELPKLASQFLKNPNEVRKAVSTRALQASLSTLHRGAPASENVENAILDPQDRKEYEQRSGAFAVAQLSKIIDDPQANAKIKEATGGRELKDLSRNELTRIVPALAKADDDQLTQLIGAGYSKIETKGMVEARAKDEPAQRRFEEREARIDKQFQESQARLMKSQEGLESRFQRQQAGMDERLEKRLALDKAQRERLTPQQVNRITADKTSMATINDYEAAYNDFLKETKGKLSAVIKGSLAKNQTAQTIAEVTGIEGSTPAERKLSASYNALVGNLKSLTNEVGVLTDADALRILGSFNPTRVPEQVKANLQARRQSHERSLTTMLDTLEQTGKDVSGVRSKPKSPPATPTGPAVGAVIKGYRFKGGNPADKNNWEKVQ